jgi:hypothetical protein
MRPSPSELADLEPDTNAEATSFATPHPCGTGGDTIAPFLEAAGRRSTAPAKPMAAHRGTTLEPLAAPYSAMRPTGLEVLIGKGVIPGPLVGLYSHWDERRGECPLPRPCDLMDEGLIRWWPHLCLSEREDRTGRFRVTWAGSACAAAFGGCELSGQYLDDTLPRFDLQWLLESYQHCIRTGRPSYTLAADRRHRRAPQSLARLLLPCGERRTVSAILTASYTVLF